MRRPALAVLGLTAALPLALTLTACSSTSSGSPVSAPKPKHSASQDPDAGLATGAQLKKALAPASFFAKGFALEPSGSQDTGDTFTEQSSAPASAKPDCEKLDGTGWIDAVGVSGVSFAQNDYVSKDTSEEIAQEIDAYRGTTAATVLKDLQDTVSACTTYTDSQTHTKVKVTGTATSGLGAEAYTITITDSAWQNGTTLIATRTGKNVISVMSTAGHDNGAAMAKKLTEQILASMKNTA